jgi:hypothetical protein
MQPTIDTLKAGSAGPSSDVTDEDLRQLVIHYATFVRNPKNNDSKPVLDAWDKWPEGLFDRFKQMVFDNAFNDTPAFWVRPATVNIQYGIDA